MRKTSFFIASPVQEFKREQIDMETSEACNPFYDS